MNLTSALRFFWAHWTPSQADWLKLASLILPTSVTSPTRSCLAPAAAGWFGQPASVAPGAAGWVPVPAAGLAAGEAAGLMAGLGEATGLAAAAEGLAAIAGLAAGAVVGFAAAGAVVAAAGGLVGAACEAGWHAASTRAPRDSTAAAERDVSIDTEPPSRVAS